MISSQRLQKELKAFALMIAIGGVFYFGLQQLQSLQGKRAFAATGLEPLTLAEALEKGQTEGKPIIADLSAFWCGYCVKLDKKIFANGAVKKVINSEYIYARIDSESDEASDFKMKYQARGYPTVVLLEPDGSLIRKLDITFEPNLFLQQI